MTTLTLTQRIQQDDSVLERSASIETDETCFSVTTVGDKLVTLLHNATWTTPEKPDLPTP